MGPGAVKVDFFEPPSPGDSEHHLLTTGPLQAGLSCKGTAGGSGAIAFTLFVSIPGPTTTLSGFTVGGNTEYATISGSVTDTPAETTVAEKTTYGAAVILVLTGADGIPEWLSLSYGANTEAEESSTESLTTRAPRGCWMVAEAI
jgi:hypothetical protein